MTDETSLDYGLFVQMSREFPVRTAVFTFVLPAFALFQLLNGLVHGGSLLLIGGFAALSVGCSALLAQYQVAVYRRKQLSRRSR